MGFSIYDYAAIYKCLLWLVCLSIFPEKLDGYYKGKGLK